MSRRRADEDEREIREVAFLPADRRSDEGQTGGRFASWKFDLINAVTFDPRLKPSEVIVFIVVLQFQYGATGRLFPSQDLIAALAHMSVRNVQKCLSRLRDCRWLRWCRTNRQLSNLYEIDDSNLQDMLDYRQHAKEGVQEHRHDRHRRVADANSGSRQKDIARTGIRLPTRTTVLLGTRTAVPPNPLRKHLEGTPEDRVGIEEEVTSFEAKTA